MSFKSGYMAQRSAYAPGSRVRVGLAAGKKDRERSCLSSLLPPACSFKFQPLAMRAVQRLDGPASRNKVNDRDN
jgi:hypothetical protein